MPILKFYTEIPNVIRIKAKTNGYLIRVIIDVSRRFNSMEPYQVIKNHLTNVKLIKLSEKLNLKLLGAYNR